MKIITGASKGIGKFLFEKYLDMDEEVYGTYWSTPPEKHAEYYSKVDVSVFTDVNIWIHSLPKNKNIELINCAAMNYDSFAHKADIYQWTKAIQVNLIGTFHTILAILPSMRANQYGRIINFSSIVCSMGLMGTSAYAASKAGVEALTKVMAIENGARGITINTLKLGYFSIGMGGALPSETVVVVKGKIPTHRFGNPEEIFNAVNFLVGNPYVNGSSLTIDGGLAW